MNKGKTYLAVITLIAGIVILAFVLFLTVFRIMTAHGINWRGASYQARVQWDKFALGLTHWAVLGSLLTSFGVRHFRRRTTMK